MATKNINTMINRLEKVQTDINNLADEKWEQYYNLSEIERISGKGDKLKINFNCLYKAFGIIDDAIREMKHTKNIKS